MLATSNRLSKQCATSVRSAAHLASRQSDRNALRRLGLARSLSAAAASMEDAFDTSLTCNSCKTVVAGSPSPFFKCPNSHAASEADHVLMPSAIGAAEIASLVEMSSSDAAAAASVNPFVRFRALLYPYRVAMASGMSDQEYIALVTALDDKIKAIDGTGFVTTPLMYSDELQAFIKNESGQVAGSHKARHLFNVMTYLQVLDEQRPAGSLPMKAQRRLVVASCGNAGLAAATIAAAAEWPIDVCIPDNADPSVVANLQSLGKTVNIVFCPRDVDEVQVGDVGMVSTAGAADPTVAVFKNMISEHNSIPFSVQGSECGVAVEGVQTLAWEVLEQAAAEGHTSLDFSDLFIQVGGGALGAGLAQGLQRAADGDVEKVMPGLKIPQVPSIVTVQAEGNAPLNRAYTQMVADGKSAEEAAKDRSRYMFPWANPASIASGILDDETYDWVELARGMEKSGGEALVVNEDAIAKANAYAKAQLKVNSCITGSVGLSGLMARGATHTSKPSIVVLSGIDRASQRAFSTSAAPTTPVWERNGITYRVLERDFDPEVLFDFNKEHGTSPLNFIPDEPVKAHFAKLATGETSVWGAFDGDKLVGFITGEVGGGYWLQTGDGKQSTCFINEFVVDPVSRKIVA